MTANLESQLALLPNYLSNHLALSLSALSLGVVIGLPVAIMLTRKKNLQWSILGFASVMQTIPGIALLALMVPFYGKIGFVPAFSALFLYSLLPIMRNAVTGIVEVDASLTEAARGIGMTDSQTLFKVELPLALPVIIAGIRTATVWVVGAATLATPVGATSLGNYIFSGLQTQNLTSVLVGCTASAVLAISLDQIIRLLETAALLRSKLRATIASGMFLTLVLVGLSPLITNSLEQETRPTAVIGAKTFTEQYILAEMMGGLLSRAGFKTEIKSGMGSTILFDALKNGDVDCYVDYSGTIWANIMKRTDIPRADTLLAEMTSWLDSAYDISCIGALGFNNTYAMAIPESFAKENQIVTVTDLAPFSSAMKMGSDYEFYGRPEWAELRDQYGLNFKELISMDHSLMYQAVDEGEVDAIAAYSTDGHIAAFGLLTLADPYQALPPYDAVLLLSSKARRNGALVSALAEIVGRIDETMMRGANKSVDLDGLSASQSSQELLKQIRKSDVD